MKQSEQLERGTAMNYIALRQSILSMPMVIGGPPKDQPQKPNEPFRIIDGHPVYHIRYTDFNLPIFPEERADIPYTHWGSFKHPYLMIGMPSIGGDVELYIDTRFDGWYALVASVQMDGWGIGESECALEYVSWTPKAMDDTEETAGERLFKALVYVMDFVPDGEITTQMFDTEDWEWEWDCTPNCLEIFKQIRG